MVLQVHFVLQLELAQRAPARLLLQYPREAYVREVCQKRMAEPEIAHQIRLSLEYTKQYEGPKAT